MKPYKILIIVLAIAFCLVGGVYAKWSEILIVNTEIHTASFDTTLTISNTSYTTTQTSKHTVSFRDAHKLRVSHENISHDMTTKYVMSLYNAGSVSCKFSLKSHSTSNDAASNVRYYINNISGEGMSYDMFIKALRNKLNDDVRPGHSIKIVVYERLDAGLPAFEEVAETTQAQEATSDQDNIVLVPLYYDWEYVLNFEANVAS